MMLTFLIVDLGSGWSYNEYYTDNNKSGHNNNGHNNCNNRPQICPENNKAEQQQATKSVSSTNQPHQLHQPSSLSTSSNSSSSSSSSSLSSSSAMISSVVSAEDVTMQDDGGSAAPLARLHSFEIGSSSSEEVSFSEGVDSNGGSGGSGGWEKMFGDWDEDTESLFVVEQFERDALELLNSSDLFDFSV